jgi:hypothetical protein
VSVQIISVYMSPHVIAKINSKHGITADDVLDACQNPTRAGWHEDPERGRRLLVEGRNNHGRRVFAVLYPTAVLGIWNLGTARYL